MKLLIVDDELWSRRLVKNLLQWNAFGINEIFEADGGKGAITILESQHCDLLITDMRMPGIDGAQLLQYIHDQKIDVEIIAMSGYEDYKYLHAALKMKAIDYLLKPVVKDELKNAVLTGVTRIQKKTNNAFIEDILKRDDLKTEINTYHSYKIPLMDAVQTNTKSDIIRYARQIDKAFFQSDTNPSLISFILSDLHRTITETKQEYKIESSVYKDLLPNELEEQLLSLSNMIASRINTDQVSILQVQKFIINHVGESISLSTLANHFYVSKEHLSRLFKKEVGTGVQQYITSKKIEYAKELLRNHDSIAISTISYMCGYKDLQYFYRVFKKTTGITPAQYRESHQHNPTNTSISSN